MNSDKVVLITGATEGVGKATAAALAQQGYQVVLHGRNEAKTKAVQQEIISQTGNKRVDYLLADFSSLKEVQHLAQTFREKYPRLDVLINNAAAMFSERQVSQDGFEMMFAVNYLATYLLTELLLPLITATPDSRIIILSSVGYKSAKPDLEDLQATQKYNMQNDYFNSKLYCLYYALDLAQRLKNTGTTVNAVHPGGVRTQLARDFKGGMKILFSVMMPLFFISPEKGAETSVYVATSLALKGVTGKYFTAKKVENLKPIGQDADKRQLLSLKTKELLKKQGFV